MNITKVSEVFFSPTGGTRKSVEMIGKAWKGNKQQIDLSARTWPFTYCFDQEELCIIGVPSFGGRVPEVAVERLKNLKGNGTPALLVVAYGNRHYDDTFLELKEVVEQQGFVAVAAIAAVTEHSIMHQYGAGRPNAADEEQLLSFGKSVREALEQMTAPVSASVPGNKPYREYNGVPMKPQVYKSCSKCGLCARECPVGAIPADNPGATNSEACISCMRCVKICPSHARKNKGFLVFMAAHKMKKVCSTAKENLLFLGKGE